MFFFFPTNVLLGMSTICRKHCHMGKGGGGSHFKSDCTYFKKKQKCILSTGLTPLPCFLNSPRSRGARGEHVLWELSWDAKTERGRGGGQGEKLLLLFSNVHWPGNWDGKMHLHNTATNPVDIIPANSSGSTGACWSVLRQAHCKR